MHIFQAPSRRARERPTACKTRRVLRLHLVQGKGVLEKSMIETWGERSRQTQTDKIRRTVSRVTAFANKTAPQQAGVVRPALPERSSRLSSQISQGLLRSFGSRRQWLTTTIVDKYNSSNGDPTRHTDLLFANTDICISGCGAHERQAPSQPH